MGHQRQVFADYSLDSVSAALQKIAAVRGLGIRLSAEYGGGAPSGIAVEFRGSDQVVFHIPAEYPSAERRDFFTNRWLSTCYLFSLVKYRHPRLVGACRLWLDDFPEGTGLAFCGNSAGHVLIPDSAFLETDGYRDATDFAAQQWKPWELRADKVIWRGASTGNRIRLGLQGWREIPRFKLCLLLRDVRAGSIFDVGLSHIVQIWDAAEVAEIKDASLMKEPIPQHNFIDYRYAIDIDGNSCSWPGLFSKLILGNAVLKVDSAVGFRQWYYNRLIPWKNFVPITASMGELVEVAEWLVQHPNVASDIAERGRELARSLSYDSVVDEAAQTIYNYVAR